MRHHSAGSILLMVASHAMATQVDTEGANFCQRLAADSGIELPVTRPSRSDWTANAVSLGKRVFVGGTAATSVGVSPIEPATVEDYRRVENICLPEGQGAVCYLVGPLDFRFLWKGRKIVTRMRAGERARIAVKGTRTSCASGT